MSTILDPGKDARKVAAKSEEAIRKQKQVELLRESEAEDEKVRAAYSTGGGRRSLIKSSSNGASNLGGTSV